MANAAVVQRRPPPASAAGQPAGPAQRLNSSMKVLYATMHVTTTAIGKRSAVRPTIRAHASNLQIAGPSRRELLSSIALVSSGLMLPGGGALPMQALAEGQVRGRLRSALMAAASDVMPDLARRAALP